MFLGCFSRLFSIHISPICFWVVAAFCFRLPLPSVGFVFTNLTFFPLTQIWVGCFSFSIHPQLPIFHALFVVVVRISLIRGLFCFWVVSAICFHLPLSRVGFRFYEPNRFSPKHRYGLGVSLMEVFKCVAFKTLLLHGFFLPLVAQTSSC